MALGSPGCGCGIYPSYCAGGVADGRGMVLFLCLEQKLFRLVRVSLLLRNLMTKNFKDKILKAKDIDTVISASVVGHPVRAIKNKLATEYNQAEKRFLGR